MFVFLFEFLWLKSLVTKQKLRTKFMIFIVKLRSMIFLRIFKNVLFIQKTWLIL